MNGLVSGLRLVFIVRELHVKYLILYLSVEESRAKKVRPHVVV